MRTGNPTLSEKSFEFVASEGEIMTLGGTVNKTALLLTLTFIPAVWIWDKFFTALYTGGNVEELYPLIIGGAIAGFILALITIFFKKGSYITAPMYALCEGLFLGGVSAIFEMQFPGIVMQAVGLTFGTLAALLMAYKSGLIKATENFKLGVAAATGGIALLYLVNFILGFFINSPMPFIHEGGLIGIGFSAFVVVIAALNLVLDFDFIESGVEKRAPKYMEWYAAFGLLVTLVWLYLEILRLLAKLRSSD